MNIITPSRKLILPSPVWRRPLPTRRALINGGFVPHPTSLLAAAYGRTRAAAGGGGAPIARSTLTSGTANTVLTSQATASVSPTANTYIDLTVVYYSPGSHITITASGNSLTYVEVGHANLDADAGIYKFRALGASPSAGAITIAVSGTALSLLWAVEQYTGIDTSGTNGSGAVVQSNTVVDQTGTAAVTMSTPAADSAMIVGFAQYDDFTTGVPDTPYTELVDITESGTQMGLITAWNIPGDTSPSINFTPNAPEISGIAIELKKAA